MVRNLPHTFDAGRTPPALRRHAQQDGSRTRELASSYGRLSTDRDTAQAYNLEWVTPGHPLFEALRRHSLELGQGAFANGACFHSLQHRKPARLDFYRARLVDGLGKTIHERLFVVELTDGDEPHLVGPDLLGNLTPTEPPTVLPAVTEPARSPRMAARASPTPVPGRNPNRTLRRGSTHRRPCGTVAYRTAATGRLGNRPCHRSQRAGRHRCRRSPSPSRTTL